MAISGAEVRDIAREIIARTPGGIGPSALALEVLRMHPDMKDSAGKPSGTIRGAVWDLDRKFPGEIAKGPDGFMPGKGAPAAPASTPRAKRSPKTPEAKLRAKAGKTMGLAQKPKIVSTDASESKLAHATEDDITQEWTNIVSGLNQKIKDLEAVLDALRLIHKTDLIEKTKIEKTLVDVRAENKDLALRIAHIQGSSAKLVPLDGERIRCCRVEAGMRQADLGALMGLTRGRISTAELSVRLSEKHPLMKWVAKQEKT